LPADTVALSRFLIGKLLVHDLTEGRRIGRIVETEAYLPGDAASHAFRGERPRNRSMFLRRGHAYVYISYGVWPVLNVSSETEGVGAAVLLRALEPLAGVEAMAAARAGARPTEIARGPGNLAKAMAVTLDHDGADLCAPGALWLGAAPLPVGEIGVSVRIGITKEVERPLRFFERANPHVSGPRRLSL
jgi:DNA-3-methyladenine glycosylase